MKILKIVKLNTETYCANLIFKVSEGFEKRFPLNSEPRSRFRTGYLLLPSRDTTKTRNLMHVGKAPPRRHDVKNFKLAFDPNIYMYGCLPLDLKILKYPVTKKYEQTDRWTDKVITTGLQLLVIMYVCDVLRFIVGL